MKATSVFLPPSTIFLTRILGELDAELAQLQTVRAAVAELEASRLAFDASRLAFAEPVLVLGGEPDVLPPVHTAEPIAAPVPPPARRLGRPRGSVNRKPSQRTVRPAAAPEPRALGSTVPAGPVVVSPAELARHRSAVLVVPQQPLPSALPDGGLDALVRAVEERRSAA